MEFENQVNGTIIDEVEKQDRYFVKAFNDLILSSLTGNELKIYLYLRMYAGKKNSAFPSIVRISEEINMATRTVNTNLKSLCKKGYLYIAKQKTAKGFHNVYHILDPYYNQHRNFESKEQSNVTPISNKNDKEEKQKEQSVASFDFYQENGFGMLQPFIADQIGSWLDDFKENGDEIVIEAMKVALMNNKANWNYTNGILKAWYQKGIKSVEDIQALENQRSKQSNGTDGQLRGQALKDAMQDPNYWD
ncbi:hypothetical protein AWC37_04265 [Staphylococcus xylosus]|uniref:DnaD domain protein n=1 Tax=Staphylococcus xylosus TaxID=1288 RepID=UPI0009BFE39B|nr:DnaD domain protein [Staphylococcus xylosus]ARD74378.1 hypothetical protein AWC37_04265 [Staphylococcus xylosus]